MKIRPLGDKVLVQRLEAEAVTAGGIVLPDSAKEKPQRGTIISVGDGKLLDEGFLEHLRRRGTHLRCSFAVRRSLAQTRVGVLDNLLSL